MLDQSGKVTVDLRSIRHPFDTKPPYDRLDFYDDRGVPVISCNSVGTLSGKVFEADEAKLGQVAVGIPKSRLTAVLAASLLSI